MPDTNINQLDVSQLVLGPALLQRVPNPYFGIIPRSSSLGDPMIPLAQLLKPYPRFTTVSLYRNNVGTTDYRGLEARIERRFAGGMSWLTSYTWSRLVDDASSVFDASILTGPLANAPVADSFNRALDRDRSTGDIPHVLVTSAIWELPLGEGRRRHPSGVLGALVNDWTLTGNLTLQSGSPNGVLGTAAFGSITSAGDPRVVQLAVKLQF